MRAAVPCVPRAAPNRWITGVLLTAGAISQGGCGETGPRMYELSGTVTYHGERLPIGHIRFVPQEGLRNKDTITQALVKNGEYQVKVTGGPHRVLIRDMAGGDVQLPDVPSARRMFLKEYRTQIQLPGVEEVEQAAVQDFDIPASHK